MANDMNTLPSTKVLMAQADAKRVPDVACDRVGTELVFSFRGLESFKIDPEQFAATIREQALYHGFKQKLIDAAAISRNPDTGKSATVADKRAAVVEVLDRLYAGEWNKRREGGGVPAGGLLLQALCRLYAGRKTPEQVRAYLESKTDEERAAMRKTGKVAAAIEEIKAERAKAAPVDEATLFAGLDE